MVVPVRKILHGIRLPFGIGQAPDVLDLGLPRCDLRNAPFVEMYAGVMEPAEQDQVLRCRHTSIRPMNHVVRFGPGDRSPAP